MSDPTPPRQPPTSTRPKTRQQGRVSSPENWVPTENLYRSNRRQRRLEEAQQATSDEAASSSTATSQGQGTALSLGNYLPTWLGGTKPKVEPEDSNDEAEDSNDEVEDGEPEDIDIKTELESLLEDEDENISDNAETEDEDETEPATTGSSTSVTSPQSTSSGTTTTEVQSTSSTASAPSTYTPSTVTRKPSPPPPSPPSPARPTFTFTRTTTINMAEKAHTDNHAALGARVLTIKTAIDAHENNSVPLTLTAVEIHLDEIKELNKELAVQQKSCFTTFKNDPTASPNPQVDARTKHEAVRVMCMAAHTKLIDLSKSLSPSATTSSLKAPKVGVPRFSGNHAEWPQFKSSFSSLIHLSSIFSSSEKFRLLLEATEHGEAKLMLRDLEIVDGSYKIGWDRLCARFDSEREAVHSILKPLMNMPPLIQQTESGLYSIISCINTTRSQINAVASAIPEADILYIHFIMSKLDKKTIWDFGQTLTTSNMPTLKSVLDFLERQAKNVGLTKEIKGSVSNSLHDLKPIPYRKDKRHSWKIMTISDTEASDGYTSAESHGSQDSSRGKVNFRKGRNRPGGRKGGSVHFASRSNSRERSGSVERTFQSKKGSFQKPQGKSNRPQGTNFKPSPCPMCNDNRHRVHTCPNYTSMSVSKRIEWVNSKGRCYNCLSDRHTVKQCSSKYKCGTCKARHHTSLHRDRNAAVNAVSRSLSPATDSPSQSEGLIPTAKLRLSSTDGRNQTIARCLLDTGSMNTFITETAAWELNLPIRDSNRQFTVAGNDTLPARGKTSFNIQARTDPAKTFTVHAHVLTEITSEVPCRPLDKRNWTHLNGLFLADPTFHLPGPVDVLLGSAIVDQLMGSEKIEGKKGTPSAYRTDLGYIVMGRHDDTDSNQTVNTVNPVEPPVFNMEKFWTIEELPFTRPLSELDKFCEEHYIKNTSRLPNGRYVVRWPFVEDPTALGSSVQAAMRRWFQVERKLSLQPAIKREYNEQLEDYLKCGHMELIPSTEIQKTPNYYIPHHYVTKESSTSTKLRVVFDGSAKSTSGKSINNLMAPGPTIQPDLHDQLLKFRLRPIAVIADIKKMYRQILVHEDERNLQRLVWRRKDNGPIQHFRLCSVPFGYSSSPYLAVRTLHQLAKDEGQQYPLAAQAVLNNFYVDDFMSSQPDTATAIKLKDELIAMMATAKFELCKWSSNSKELLASIPKSLRETQVEALSMDETPSIKTLGLMWDPAKDNFFFTVSIKTDKKHTKRSVLSDISKVFDPLGFLAPVIIKAKILMQKIWTAEIDWDQELPETLLQEWLHYSSTLSSLGNIKIPRCLEYYDNFEWELHGFSDASEKAYSAAVYLRGQNGDQVTCKLVTSKTRVAPLKTNTIPRLELEGAVLLAKLVDHVKKQWDIKYRRIQYWTDSSIVLSWINSSPTRWKIYVANRVAQIQETTTKDQWSHVVSEDNPSDCASRGIDPEELQSHPLWWQGPSWLRKPTYEIPEFIPSSFSSDVDRKEEKKILTIISSLDNYVIESLCKLSSWKKVLRVVALLLDCATTKSFRRNSGLPIASESISAAERRVVKRIQDQAYPHLEKECGNTADGRKGNKFSKRERHLNSLNLFRDSEGIYRIGGRIERAEYLSFDTKHPMLLPGTHPLVKVLMRHTHQTLAHSGPQTTNLHLRLKYWIPNATKSIKSVIDKCVTCFRYKAQPMSQMMSGLPASRITPARPFQHCGVDMAGPYELKNFTGRAGKFKTYICLFTCFTTRAIHLELVASLSQEGFLLAFRRFMSRRGKPTHMYSDNGTNFVSAYNYLQNVQQNIEVTSRKILPGIDMDQIQWHFSPPRGPHFGGTWEIMVKLVKNYLNKILTTDAYTWEQFETILIFVEGLVNSRPLTPMSNDPEDFNVLTPAHFLIGSSLQMAPDHDVTHIRLNRLDDYQLVLRRQEELWKLWQTSYITSLQKRKKWQHPQENLKVGDLVLICEDNQKPMHWRVGRVKKTHPSKDALIRVTTVETEGTYIDKKGKRMKISKEFVRPIVKLAKLPVQQEGEENSDFSSSLHPSKENSDSKSNLITTVRPKIVTKSPAEWICAVLSILCIQQGADAQATEPPEFPIQDTTISTTIAFIALLFAILGVLGNSVTILAILNDKKLRSNNVHYCIISLCMSDLIFSAVVLPMTFSKYYHQGWIHSLWACQAYSFMLYSTLICSILNMVTVTLNRYVKIVYPHHYMECYDNTTTLVLIAITWTASIFTMLLPALGIWGEIGRKPEDPDSCSILPDQYGYSIKPYIWTIGVWAPLAVLIICYTHIYIHVRRTRNNLIKMQNSSVHLHDAKRKREENQLTRMICIIVLGFIICFQPVIVLNVIDSAKQRISPIIHAGSSILAWTTSFLNLIIYISTNQCYREAYKKLFRRKRTTSGSMISTSTLTISLSLLMMIGTCTADYEANPDVTTKVPPCDVNWNTHHIIPTCINQVSWLHIQNNGSVCYRNQTCGINQMVTADAKGCMTPPAACSAWKNLTLDNWECQTFTAPTGELSRLKLPEIRSGYCAVGDYTLRNCQKFIEEFNLVPVVMVGTQIYPMAVVNIVQDAQQHLLSSYRCLGQCTDLDCAAEQCTGDGSFCAHFNCGNSLKSACSCSFDPNSIMHKVVTNEGPVTPTCWTSMHLLVKKEDKTTQTGEDPCQDCSVTCLSTGIEVVTPGKIAKYIKAAKNPGYVSTIPTSKTTTLQYTANMLTSSGVSTIEIWFADFDLPTVYQRTCQRLSVCAVINCHFCLARWQNYSCYTSYNWIILSLIGTVLTIIFLITLYVTRVLMAIARFLCWPLRKILQYYQNRNIKKRSSIRLEPDEEDAGQELLEVSTGPYRSPSRGNRRRREYIPGTQVLFCCTIIACIGLSYGCANFAMMSAASTECKFEGPNRVCSIRIGTRLEVSPVEQSSCLKIDDNKRNLLGTITVKTKTISLRCKKELLYYVPRSVVRCQSSINCYSLYSTSECYYENCINFKSNATVKAFKHSAQHLGYSSCLSVRVPTCPFPWTHDCHFYRWSLENPTNEVFSVFTCDEWQYAVTLEVTVQLGQKRTTNTTTLYPGSTRTIDGIEFNLISASIPPSPLLSECIIQSGGRYAVSGCNLRSETTAEKIGEVQCFTMKSAQQLDNSCLTSQQLVRATADAVRAKCTAEIIDPAKIMQTNQLPLKLANGVLVPFGDSVSFESSSNSLLEIQMTTQDSLQISKEIQMTKCTADVIKIVGCYGCTAGATLLLEAKTEEGEIVASLECPDSGFFTPLHITPQLQRHTIIMKLDTPEVDLKCTLTCSRNVLPLHIKGHLHYLDNVDVRTDQEAIAFEPHQATSGFNFLSLSGVGYMSYIYRGLAIVAVVITCVLTLNITLQLVLKKIV